MEQNTKYLHRIAVAFLNFNIIIFCFNSFQLHHPSVVRTTCMFIFIPYSLFIHYVKFTIYVIITFILAFFWNFGSNVVPVVWPWKECTNSLAFFPVFLSIHKKKFQVWLRNEKYLVTCITTVSKKSVQIKSETTMVKTWDNK